MFYEKAPQGSEGSKFQTIRQKREKDNFKSKFYQAINNVGVAREQLWKTNETDDIDNMRFWLDFLRESLDFMEDSLDDRFSK